MEMSGNRHFLDVFEPILDEELIPKELVSVLRSYLKNPSASSTGHSPLVEILKSFDPPRSTHSLHTLAEGQAFSLKNLHLIKGKLRRTRYFCKEVHSNKNYLVAKHAQVTPLDPAID